MIIRIDNRIINTDLLTHAFARVSLDEIKQSVLCAEMIFVFKNKSEISLEYRTASFPNDIRLKAVEDDIAERFFKHIENEILSMKLSDIVNYAISINTWPK